MTLQALPALRAALRQAPKVILVGEMRDRETIEIALEAAETGHLVLSTLHTIDASKTVERVVGVFPMAEQHVIRNRLAKSFRYIISQRLLPRKDGRPRGRVGDHSFTVHRREYIEKGEIGGKTILDAMRDGDLDGMQCFDGVIENSIRDGVVDLETGIDFSLRIPATCGFPLATWSRKPRGRIRVRSIIGFDRKTKRAPECALFVSTTRVRRLFAALLRSGVALSTSIGRIFDNAALAIAGGSPTRAANWLIMSEPTQALHLVRSDRLVRSRRRTIHAMPPRPCDCACFACW